MVEGHPVEPVSGVSREMTDDPVRFDASFRYLSEMRRRSLLMKLAHPLFAILAVWCLGCSSFDSLLERAFAASASTQVDCMSAPTGQDATRDTAPSVVRADHEQQAADGCGCSHCLGVQQESGTISPIRQPVPEAVIATIGRELRADREPLVPPPQGRVEA